MGSKDPRRRSAAKTRPTVDAASGAPKKLTPNPVTLTLVPIEAQAPKIELEVPKVESGAD